MVMVVFGFVVLIIIGGGILIARLATVAKSKGSWVWGFFILIFPDLYSSFSVRYLRVVT